MSLFTALFPPEDVVAELHAALRPVRRAHPRLRWVDPRRWHVTVGFFGDIEPSASAEPAEQLAGLEGVAAPVLRLRGSGHFRQVLWIGVEGAAPAALGRAAAGVREDWRPHLTVARGAPLPHVDFTGREWTATEVALVLSRPGAGYTVLDRVPLTTPNE
ncbi:2'-5' RNA ligase family protein [Saccharothrix xinjiangensis]|uniref:RNA 2',3'-cyclic phosphodiesterase n=1 Tax=Saccharothrix xinjiangensis TaxID=204798 RepID=A0ABV9XTL9_9PSEU